MKSAFRLLALLSWACAVTWAQGTAQIHGTIQDATGAAVPGAEVKAIQIETGLTRAATTGAAGEYVLTPLPVGPYRIEVSKEGFTKVYMNYSFSASFGFSSSLHLWVLGLFLLSNDSNTITIKQFFQYPFVLY